MSDCSPLSELMAELAEAGAPPEAIMIAIRAVECERMKLAEIRAKRAAQKRKERASAGDNTATVVEMSRDNAATVARLSQENPPPKNVPHTPYKITPPIPSLRSGSFEREHAEFLDWAWRAIPKRRGDSPKPFRKALLKAIRDGADPDAIRTGLLAYRQSEADGDAQFRKGATVWVNAAGWEADYSLPKATPPPAKINPWLELEMQERAERNGFGKDREHYGSGDEGQPAIELACDEYRALG